MMAERAGTEAGELEAAATQEQAAMTAREDAVEALERLLSNLESWHPGDKLWIRVHDDGRPWGVVYTTSTANYL